MKLFRDSMERNMKSRKWSRKMIMAGFEPFLIEVNGKWVANPYYDIEDHTDELSELINPRHIIGGLCRIISKIKSPGVISHFGMEPEIVFGELDHSMTDRVSNLKSVFDVAGIKSRISLDIQADLWNKFIAICVSGLLAVTKTTYGELRELNETKVLMLELLNEIYQLSQKIEINRDQSRIWDLLHYCISTRT
ncbi:MAG TPA: hypothetical protein DC042_00445 [Bacteroidales bacterium]|nr:hypothetical protein [Bacteroidales bacterium]